MQCPTIPAVTEFCVKGGRVDAEADAAAVATRVVEGVFVGGICVGQLFSPGMDLCFLFVRGVHGDELEGKIVGVTVRSLQWRAPQITPEMGKPCKLLFR